MTLGDVADATPPPAKRRQGCNVPPAAPRKRRRGKKDYTKNSEKTRIGRQRLRKGCRPAF